jgi:hypothetical protein
MDDLGYTFGFGFGFGFFGCAKKRYPNLLTNKDCSMLFNLLFSGIGTFAN